MPEDGSSVSLILFVLAIPWKLIGAAVPPPGILNGWACFLVALVFIGFLTALIGDLASHMGCCMGLTPSVTAITFVALGTSLPDTFASMSAARSEPYADASIVNKVSNMPIASVKAHLCGTIYNHETVSADT